MEPQPRPRLLGVFAHPDDEVFCAGGTLARCAAAGCVTAVVSATRGDAGQIRDARVATPQTLGNVREQELHRACSLLGVAHVSCMDYLDGTLQSVKRTILVDDLATVICELRPCAVITFGPDGAYGHPDHMVISRAVTAACRKVAGDAEAHGAGARSGIAPRLYYSVFPKAGLMLSEWLPRELSSGQAGIETSPALAHVLALLADDLAIMRYTGDYGLVRWFPPNMPIVCAGDGGAALHLVLSGCVEVREEGDPTSPRDAGRRGPGYVFGGRATARGGRHAARVVAATEVTCLVLSPRLPD